MKGGVYRMLTYNFDYPHDFIHKRIKAALLRKARIRCKQGAPVNRAARSGEVFGEVTAHGDTGLETVQSQEGETLLVNVI